MTYTNKTQPTAISPENFLEKNFSDKENLQKEAQVLIEFYTKVTGTTCVMWNKLFGFGKYHYQDSKGGAHIYFMTGFGISSTGFTLYNLMGWAAYQQDLVKIGKYKLSGKSCLAIKSVADIDLKILETVVKKSLVEMKKKYKTEQS